jgi:dimethyladenosine transferase
MEQHNFKKKFGQNFLTDENIIKKIIATASVEKDSLVIEIGPGSGMLTKELNKISKVLAYEIDLELEDRLGMLNLENTTIIFDDFLKRDIKEDLEKYDYKKLYVVANLPYYITTPILTKLIETNLDIEKIVIMVQKEVADRFTSLPKNKDYGSITVFLNYYFSIKREFIVSRKCFIPSPNVDSAVISLNKRNNRNLATDENKFFKLVRDSFQFKRKTLKNNLKNYDLSNIEKTLKKHNMTLTTRAEEISLDIFINISNNL